MFVLMRGSVINPFITQVVCSSMTRVSQNLAPTRLRKHFNESSIKYFPKQKTVLNKCYWTVCRESSINFFIVSNPRSKGVEKAALWFSAAIFT